MPVITMSKLERPIPKPLREIHEMLKEAFDDVLFRWSAKGVPHIVVTTPTGAWSMCYFGKHKSYRVFFPYLSKGLPQIKRDFTSLRDIIKYIKGEIYDSNKV